MSERKMLFLWAGGHGHGDGRDVRHGGQGPQREAREEGVHQGNANIILILYSTTQGWASVLCVLLCSL